MAKKESLKDRAYNVIKKKIVCCEYNPGQFLIESDLMEVVGASRTPIREALSKLEQEGLLDILPKRGVMVRSITMADINEVFEVRILVEPYIIRQYGNMIPYHLKEELLQSLDMTGEEARGEMGYRKDQALHEILMNICQNNYFVDLLQRLYAQNHRLRILSGDFLSYRAEETVQEHRAVIKALLNNDYEGAAEAMLLHLQKSKEAAINVMINAKIGSGMRAVRNI